MTRFIMLAVPEREVWIPEIQAQIPQLEVVRDLTRNVLDTFMRALLEVGDGPAVLLEDDILLTGDFVPKIESAIALRPTMLQQFFSLRKTDILLGSRLMPGPSFCMGQCYYVPGGFAAALYEYWPFWPGRYKHPIGNDTVVAGFLASRREKYWLHVPSLVQHRIAKSAIDPRRSSRRQSPSFVQ